MLMLFQREDFPCLISPCKDADETHRHDFGIMSVSLSVNKDTEQCCI